MIVRIITIQVAPGKEKEFEEVTRRNHRGSVQEPGVLRFDVLRSLDTPGKYVLYEVYTDEEATKAHKETEHYKEWKEAAETLTAGPRSGEAFAVIAPEDPEKWRS
ncbi:antibiotic biosynthesis monooxygenase [Spirochaeta thermophila]|uniref:Putative inner membrane protein n=1 Tax=Winmispira thermophila (strain ATCC 49972 / DSM 6192 / RI 19.B1) TaxID=665571 RepID=E0RTK2_WINT6|nr:antibiotic biosynthesis monooxygenase [Spirochaeta thermophila]ADN02233.1 putative inner membrane protein [Spirochaeta thermophila DSM 6192]